MTIFEHHSHGGRAIAAAEGAMQLIAAHVSAGERGLSYYARHEKERLDLIQDALLIAGEVYQASYEIMGESVRIKDDPRNGKQ